MQSPQNEAPHLGVVRHLLRIDNSKGTALEVLDKAKDAGLSFIDVTGCLDIPDLGNWVRENRDGLTIAAQFSDWSLRGDAPACDLKSHVRNSCEKVLSDLNISCLDLFYQKDTFGSDGSDGSVGSGSILDAMQELKALVSEGKIRSIGLGPCTPEILKKAHAIHPIAAVAVDWCVWGAGKNWEVIKTCNELGISVLASEPLGIGLIPGSLRQPRDIRLKVGTIMKRYFASLSQRISMILSRPAATVARRAKIAVRNQSAKLSQQIMRIYEKQDAIFIQKLTKSLDGKHSCFANRMEVFLQRQSKKMELLLEKVLSDSYEQLCRKLSTQKSGNKMCGEVEKARLHLAGTLVSKIEVFRSHQRGVVLERLRRKAGEDSPVVRVAVEVVKSQKKKAHERIHGFHSKQVTFLLGRLSSIHAKRKKEALECATLAMGSQFERISKRLSEVLYKGDKLPTQVLRTTAAKGTALQLLTRKRAAVSFDGMAAKAETLVAEHEARTREKVTEVVKRRSAWLAERALNVTEEYLDSDELAKKCDEERLELGKEILEKGSLFNRKLRQVAKEKGCKAHALALAWMQTCGENVFVVNKVSEVKAVERVQQASHLKILDHEVQHLQDALNEFHSSVNVPGGWVNLGTSEQWEVLAID